MTAIRCRFSLSFPDVLLRERERFVRFLHWSRARERERGREESMGRWRNGRAGKRSTHLLFPTPRIMVAEPVASARAAKAAAVEFGVSPAAIAAAFCSFAIF